MFPLKSGKQEVSFRKRPHEIVQSNLILSCSSSGWNAKDDNKHRAARCSPDRDGCRHYCGSGCTRRNLKPRNLADDLPRCLDRCTASAERVADCTDAALFRKLVGGTGPRAMQRMADHDAPRNSSGSPAIAVAGATMRVTRFRHAKRSIPQQTF
jgi:hypothetical protein